MALRINDFEAGNIHYLCHYKGWALKSRLFWAQMALAALLLLPFQGPSLIMA
jgi:hypothetical protein